jgi:hypothetical protein
LQGPVQNAIDATQRPPIQWLRLTADIKVFLLRGLLSSRVIYNAFKLCAAQARALMKIERPDHTCGALN